MTDTPMNEPLTLMAQNEKAIASLYEEYARQLPGEAVFWLDLAEQERQHAMWIDSINQTSDSSAAYPNRFKIEAIRTFTNYLRSQEETARKGITSLGALSTAYYIETALIERQFFEQFPQDNPRASSVMSALRRETESHVRKVKDALSRIVTSKNHDAE